VGCGGFSFGFQREAKAKKILKLLEEEGVCLEDKLLLDIGSGSGGIAHYIGRECRVVSVDIRDNRMEKEGYHFVLSGVELPFSDGTFDLIISNHVIEHVSSPDKHLSEISRVLRDDGLCYLATPSRWWPWEVHYHLPLLHYLPWKGFNRVMKWLGMYSEDLRLVSLGWLRRYSSNLLSVNMVSHKVMHDPERYHLDVACWKKRLLGVIPIKIHQFIGLFGPTVIVIMRKL
jgi:SAM-dependent methyltransferase